MNLQQIETFRIVADLGSLTRASAAMHVPVSTISMRLRELERSLGAILFERDGRGVHLTPVGRDILALSHDMSRTLATIRARVSDADTVAGTLRIGVAELVAVTWLPAFIRELRTCMPLLSTDFHVDLSGPMWRMLDLNEIDMLIMPMPSGRDLGYGYVDVGEVRFSFIARADLVAGERDAARVLERHAFIRLGPGSILSRTTDDAFARLQCRPKRFITANSMAVSATLVREGVGIALLPDLAYQAELSSGRLALVPGSGTRPVVPFRAAFRDHPPNRLVDAVAEIARRASTFGAADA